MRLRLLLLPLLLLTTQACLSLPAPREGTRPLRTGEETAKTAQEDTLKDLDASKPPSLVLYSTSADARVAPAPDKTKTSPKTDDKEDAEQQPANAAPQATPNDDGEAASPQPETPATTTP